MSRAWIFYVYVFFNFWRCFMIAAGPNSIFYVGGHDYTYIYKPSCKHTNATIKVLQKGWTANPTFSNLVSCHFYCSRGRRIHLLRWLLLRSRSSSFRVLTFEKAAAARRQSGKLKCFQYLFTGITARVARKTATNTTVAHNPINSLSSISKTVEISHWNQNTWTKDLWEEKQVLCKPHMVANWL